MHILSPETDNCPSWISGRERMTVENISQSMSTKVCCRPRRGLNPRPTGLQSDGASNWATEAGFVSLCMFVWMLFLISFRVFQPLLAGTFCRFSGYFYTRDNFVTSRYFILSQQLSTLIENDLLLARQYNFDRTVSVISDFIIDKIVRNICNPLC